MNVLQQAFDRRLKPYTVFYLYRWITWLVAAIVVLVSGIGTSLWSVHIWLLVFTGLLNVMATGMAQAYTHVAQRRPFLFTLDIVVSISLIWASSGRLAPFFPYALGALILPSLLLGWRGRVLSALAFVLLDQTLLHFLGEGETFSTLLMRIVTPMVFTFMWSVTTHIAHHSKPEATTPTHGSIEVQTQSNRHPALERSFQFSAPRSFQGAEKQSDQAVETVSPEPSVAAMETAGIAVPRLQPASRQSNQDICRSIRSVPIRPEIELKTALSQLGSTFSRESAVVLHLSLTDSSKHLSPVKQITLIKLAQEALLNVQQHAHAQSAVLTLNYEPSTVTLTVQDDGVGLLDGTHERPGIHALRAMHYRLAELDGRLEVFEGERGGVTVRGVIPLGNS